MVFYMSMLEYMPNLTKLYIFGENDDYYGSTYITHKEDMDKIIKYAPNLRELSIGVEHYSTVYFFDLWKMTRLERLFIHCINQRISGLDNFNCSRMKSVYPKRLKSIENWRGRKK